MERKDFITEINKMLEKLSDRYLEIIYHTIKTVLDKG